MIRLTDEEFGRLLAGFTRSAFHYECQPAYALDIEREAFDRFLAGEPQPPTSYPWWKAWLDQVAALTAAGKTIGRLRVLSEPPTDYQRSEQWADPWHTRAGEQIRYMTHGRAEQLGLPLDHDWWLLDDKSLIVMRFTPGGELIDKTLTTGRAQVTPYLEWRDLAVRSATPAEHFTAA